MRVETIDAADYVAQTAKSKGKSPICKGCGNPRTRCECLERALLQQIDLVGLPPPIREIRFTQARRWRFDMGYPERQLAIECEGGTFVSGAHGRGKHYESDCEKYNTATLLGWRILRFTTDMIRDGRAIRVIEEAMTA